MNVLNNQAMRELVGPDSVGHHFERSEANGVSISPECGDARFARASFVGSYGSTESRPTSAGPEADAT